MSLRSTGLRWQPYPIRMKPCASCPLKRPRASQGVCRLSGYAVIRSVRRRCRLLRRTIRTTASFWTLLSTNPLILVEKPLRTTSGHCREVLAKAEKRSAPVWIPLEYRSMPTMQRLLAGIDGSLVGAPRMMSIRGHRLPFLEKVADRNRFNVRTGGTLAEKCFCFRSLLLLALKSVPVRVYASAGIDVNHPDETSDGPTPDMMDNGFVTADFENGAQARVDAKAPGPAWFSADGKERAADVETSQRATKGVRREEMEVDETAVATGDHHGSTFIQHRRVRDLLEVGQGAPKDGLLDGLWSVVVGEAAERSARTGQAVEIDL